MNIIESIVLGIIQGLTEFLPISSSGHLALAQKMFGMQNAGFFLEALLHIGTLVAVFIAFRKLIAGLAIIAATLTPFTISTGTTAIISSTFLTRRKSTETRI